MVTDQLMLPPQPTTSHSNWSLGIDGGRSGAAVLLCPSSVLRSVIEWKCRNRKSGKVYSVFGESGQVTHEVRHPYQIGKSIRERILSDFEHVIMQDRMIVTSEDVYVGRNFKTSVELAKFCGSVVGHVDDLDRSGIATWVKAEKWRRELLNVGSFTKRAVAKEASLRLVPKLVDGLNELLIERGQIDHLTDACGIAVWALRSR